MDETAAYMELIRENIDYDIVMQDYEWKHRDMYEELYQIICDVVCVPRQEIRIAGEDYPYRLVKSRFLKLKKSHLEYVIGCMERNTTKIANIKAYLITALYNAPNTICHYDSAEVNYDISIWVKNVDLFPTMQWQPIPQLSLPDIWCYPLKTVNQEMNGLLVNFFIFFRWNVWYHMDTGFSIIVREWIFKVHKQNLCASLNI